jgi:2-methylcitrate dehydratase PrpD
VAAVLHLPENQVLHAFGAAATQVSGLTASFGTMAKPMHAGKAAFNGVFAAELAAAGFESAADILEPDRGLGPAIIQDPTIRMPAFHEADGWEVLRNTFKPYACCLLTHAAVDAARALAERVKGRPVLRVTARVYPLALRIAGKPNPTSPLEAKFSTAFCVALGLAGRSGGQADFSDATLHDPLVRDLTGRTEVVAAPEFEKTAAEVRVAFADGGVVAQTIPLAKGNPGNPMSWEDLWGKFSSLVEPVLGARTEELFQVLRDFEKEGRLLRLAELVGQAPYSSS